MTIGYYGGWIMRRGQVNSILCIDRGGEGLGFPLEDLPNITTQKRKKQAKRSLRHWNMIGADTETIEGRLWLFSTEHGVWECPTFNHLLNILYDDNHSRKWKKGGKRGRVCKEYFYWNLKFDAQAILRMLHPSVAQNLTESVNVEGDISSNKVVINADTGNFLPEVRGRMVEISYLEGKSLVITPKNWSRGPYKLGPCWMWDISQFYGKLRLNTASKRYLGKSKIEKCFDGSILDASRFDEEDYRNLYREDIDRYAIVDAILAGELARLKLADFVQSKVRFIKPYSLANVAQRNLLDTCKIPTINNYLEDKPRTILQQAHTSYRGGWFETVGSGYHPSIQSLDLASAYPYILREMPDIQDPEGAWFSGDGGEEFLNWLNYRKPYSLGFGEVFFLFEDGMKWHPLARMSESGTIVTPRLVRGWFSADEIAEALKWPHTQFILGKWSYFEEGESTRPFAPFIDHFYEMKMNSATGSVERGVSKTMLNSIYGKTRQAVNNKAGKLWNPMYASVVTGGTRARLAELIRVNDYSALSVATDGVIFPSDSLKRIPNRPVKSPHNLGQWELEEAGELALLMSGVYSIRTEDYTKTVFRGGASLFLNRTDLFGFCENNMAETEKSVTIRRPYSAGEARVRGNMELMNIFRPVTQTIRPRGDSTKRLWGADHPVYFGDLLSQWWTSNPHQQV